MKSKSNLFGRRVRNADGVRPPWRSINAEAGKSRTVSFYVPKSDVFLWNSFVCYLTQHRSEHVNRGVLRAIRFFIQNLDYEEQRKFRLALRQVAEEDAAEAVQIHEFLQSILAPGERVDKIMSDRSSGMVARRQRLFRDSLQWFGVWEEYQKEFNLIDPDASTDDHSEETFLLNTKTGDDNGQ